MWTDDENKNSDRPSDEYELYDPSNGGFSQNDAPSGVCNTHDFPLYDPNYYDDYCDAFYWCWREYDPIDCSPVSANGWTELEAMYVISGVYWVPAYLVWGFYGFWLLPWSTCALMSEYDYYYCTLMYDLTMGFSFTWTSDGVETVWSIINIIEVIQGYLP